ncbi:hypothetical protein jhhlp_001420 [Lomentospora prolificans]|uniref:Suppressor of anucleate metulae protein B n=1 Tax=Lomentospora prolificans TaxID=41688 RepID=A0A2N3NIE1_9PEZI|nr:hypothetical protein jhhlp_001420 [Lomentospora prolificans]
MSVDAAAPALPPGLQPDYTLPLIKDWTPTLRQLRDSRRRCGERVSSIEDACRSSCNKKHVIECKEHYGSVIDAIRDRYFSKDTAAEWFYGRQDFLKELSHLLDEAKELRARLSDVESRVQKEKAAWYREVLARYPYFVDVAENSSGGAAEFSRALADEAQSTEDLARVVRKGIGRVRGRPINVDDYLAAVTSAQATGDTKKMKEEVIQFLFEVNGSGKILEGSEKYAEMYRESEDLSIEKVINAIDADRRAAVGGGAIDKQSGPPLGAAAMAAENQTSSEHTRRVEQVKRAQKAQRQRRVVVEEKRRHMDELQRAKTAHKKIQHAKSEKKHRQLPKEFYDTPPCEACSKPVDHKDLIACALCQVLVHMGLQATQVAYCSMQCFEKAHERHLEITHTCEAGKYCIQVRNTSSSKQEAPPKDAESPQVCLCKECVNQLGKAIIYCSLPCASSNLKMHLEEAHRSIWEEVKSQQQPASKDGNDGGGRTHEDEVAAAAHLPNVGKFVESLEDIFQARIGSKLAGKEVKVEYLPRWE